MLPSRAYVLIIAGGEGVRFQPLSTSDRPKQFLNLIGDKSLIRQTFERLKGAIDPERIYVATNVRYADLVRRELPEISLANIICEPQKKNTAPAIGFSAAIIHRADPEAIQIVLPSDHVILDTSEFIRTLGSAVEAAMLKKTLVTLGIRPTSASPEYGYIKRGKLLEGCAIPAYWVEQFVEKPTVSKAQEYLASGLYYWNSGMFVWQTQTILEEISNTLPELADAINHLPRRPDTADVVTFFERSPQISIDYGVMERSARVIVIPSDFGWSDVGTWDSLRALAGSGAVQLSDEAKRVVCEMINEQKPSSK